MRDFLIGWVIICPFFLELACASTVNDNHYMAGVVEVNFENLMKDSSATSIKEYLKIIHSEEAKNLDIIVFPESALAQDFSTFIPNIDDKLIPCGNVTYDGPISEISCAAKNTSKYIVINLTEKSKCPEPNDPRPCASNEHNLFNTNVVFDRNGTVISKYRKFNLYGEGEKNITYKPELATFDTDFGVKFGHFICFDILFDAPALELTKLGIKDIIFTSMWFSELPFLTAVQVQQGWAYVNNVNLIASGANFPKIGSTGSGIYAGKNGKLVSVMNSQPLTKLYTAKVPKSGVKTTENSTIHETEENDMSDLFLKRDWLNVYETKLLPNKSSKINESICHEDLCCDFDIDYEIDTITEENKFYMYRLAVYDGNRTFDGLADGDVFSCGVIACTDDTIESCGKRFDKGIIVEQKITKFHSIEISGMFRSSKTLVMPSSLRSNILPLDVEAFDYLEGKEFEKEGKLYKPINFKLKTEQSGLLTFAIYGRSFETSTGNIKGSTMNIIITVLILIIMATFIGY